MKIQLTEAYNYQGWATEGCDPCYCDDPFLKFLLSPEGADVAPLTNLPLF